MNHIVVRARIDDRDRLQTYVESRLSKFFNPEHGVENVYCKIKPCREQPSKYNSHLVVKLEGGEVMEVDVCHFYHHKAFDDTVKKMRKKMGHESIISHSI